MLSVYCFYFNEFMNRVRLFILQMHLLHAEETQAVVFLKQMLELKYGLLVCSIKLRYNSKTYDIEQYCILKPSNSFKSSGENKYCFKQIYFGISKM